MYAMSETDELFAKAVVFAQMAHFGQFRIFSKEPYIVHPLKVSELVLGRWPEIKDLEVLRAAAVLHDVLEDTWVDVKTLDAMFGKKVAGLVWEVSDDKSIPKPERTIKYNIKLSNSSDYAKILKLADIEANVSECKINSWWRRYLKKAKECLMSMDIPKGRFSSKFRREKKRLLRKIESYS
jgi:guanosine-3',5'-bis(diphosphate) 3'-pyrophosphohydrolase